MARKLTTRQVADIAGVQARTVHLWRREGKLPAERRDDVHGGFYYVFDEDVVKEFIADPGRRDRRRTRGD